MHGIGRGYRAQVLATMICAVKDVGAAGQFVLQPEYDFVHMGTSHLLPTVRNPILKK